MTHRAAGWLPAAVGWVVAAAGWALAAPALAAPRDYRAAADDQVLERLAPRVRSAADTPQQAAEAAQRWIELAREAADPRYLGRAQSVLSPWWNRDDAPAAVLVLQATIEQSRHEFDRARATLTRALQRDPGQAQAWLTLATLERLGARYPQANEACRRVAQAGAALHAAACQLETASLQGRGQQATAGFEALRQQAPERAMQAWLWSLQGENEERAGRDVQAAVAYRASLALAPDGYTALAYADLLLRTGRAAEALRALDGQPASDAVLLRRAYAQRLNGDAQWRAQAMEMAERLDALDARGDPPAQHARERALAALWLQDRPDRAWQAAERNLVLQKEPLDWWLALHSAERAGRREDLARVQQQLAASGLRDVRLARWQPGGPAQ